MQHFPWLMNQGGKQSIKRPMEGSGSTKGKSWVPKHPEEGTGRCPRVSHPLEHWRGTMWGGEPGTAEVTARIGLNLQDLKVSRSLGQLVQNSHMWLGEPHFALCSASLREIYSPEQISAQGSSPAPTHPMWELPQNIQHVRKKLNFIPVLKLHQPLQLSSFFTL